MIETEFDVLIVGAGLSGISAAYHLQTRCPWLRYAILEGRAAIGGTWDLFRYPGVRSDSDMYTLGFSFRGWEGEDSIADGASILRYVSDTAREHGIDQQIRYDSKVVAAEWSTPDACWTVTVRDGAGEEMRLRCNFLAMCSGYYDYARGHDPEFAGAADFRGTILHPQFWPEDADWQNKRVVVIGSGATAVTLVPVLARDAAHVTMLQRSPTFIVSRPSRDAVATRVRKLLPRRLAYRAVRAKNVLSGMFFYQLARRKPTGVKRRMIEMVREELGPEHDIATHFTPSYNPWDQRVCLVPDGDLFAAIRDGRASVETDRIDRFEADGVRLASGKLLPADVIVTATGLEVQMLGGVAFTVDGKQVELSRTLYYKGMMFSDVPNLASWFGYTNASWTLRADLTSRYVCRLLREMRRRRVRQATPRESGPIAEVPFLDFTSGYVQRARARFPRQGDRKPWRLHQNYLLDLAAMRFGPVDDAMEFSNPVPG